MSIHMVRIGNNRYINLALVTEVITDRSRKEDKAVVYFAGSPLGEDSSEHFYDAEARALLDYLDRMSAILEVK